MRQEHANQAWTTPIEENFRMRASMRLSAFCTRSFLQVLDDVGLDRGKRGFPVVVSTAQRLGNDAVDELVAQHVVGRQFQGFRGLLLVVPERQRMLSRIQGRSRNTRCAPS